MTVSHRPPCGGWRALSHRQRHFRWLPSRPARCVAGLGLPLLWR